MTEAESRRQAEEMWQEAFNPWSHADFIEVFAAALRRAEAEGIEKMRDAAHPLMRWPEDHAALDDVAARLLAEGGRT